MFGLSDQQPQLQQRQPVGESALFDRLHGSTDLGDLMGRVIGWVVSDCERHADSVLRARRGNATVTAD